MEFSTPGKTKNKTYVVRSGRMSKLQKQALEEYMPVYGIPFTREQVDLSQYFQNRNDVTTPLSPETQNTEAEGALPTILEIGCGKGEATLEIADTFRNTNFVGIEVYPPGAGKILHEIHRLGLENLRVIKHDAVQVVEEMIADNTLSGIHIFFPDPWPKKKHHKRRLIQKEFARTLAHKLLPGGYIYAVTDWEDYAWNIVYTLEWVDSLYNQYDVFAPSLPWRPKTHYEEKGLKKEHLVREIFFRRKE